MGLRGTAYVFCVGENIKEEHLEKLGVDGGIVKMYLGETGRKE